MQFLDDMLDCPIDRPRITETTAFGVAWLAGYTSGLWPGIEGFSNAWQRDRRFVPAMDPETRSACYAAWQASVAATIAQSRPASAAM
ncbi:FGGY-family carbohydrate kinase [Sagittula stellata]|uniref:Glycerol kinase protein n=1 Tax=Sagittula stellata (strain ATCC 700073 / DSM 11524 / E-37) TaxID=388399 RepID=A3K4H7_SAGS3|nr:FGGY-family carbohydrate kinase [Sagittula stellata]EBA07876.1 glycerol kinase protein [Sagittula stellata E-37]